ncbi:MAG: hypothetical protein WCP55_25525, partial [Lentisphaerota bacterium]
RETNISDHSIACLPGCDVSRWLTRGGFQWQDSSVVVERSVERILWFEPIWDRLVKKEDAENSFSSAPVNSVLAFSLSEKWKKGEFKGTDGNVNWSAKTKLDLKPGASSTHLIAIVGEALGSAPSSENICSRLASKAAMLQKNGDWNKALEKGKTLWTGFLQKVPKLKTEWPENIQRHYFKSWTVPFYNLIPATNLGHVNLRHPSVMCNRIAHGGFTVPASWEAALGALMLSYVMPDTAAEIIEGIYSSADEDGFIAEMIGGTRHTQLAYIEPCIALACVRNGAEPAFLNRSWELMRRHFVYRMHHPNWRHMSNVSLRNTAYNYYSAKGMVALAKLLGRPSSEIARFEKGAKDAAIAVNAFWNEKDGGFHGYYDHIRREFVPGGDAESFITLAGAAMPEKRRQLLEIMRNHYLTENGAIRAYPVGLESVKAPNKKLANTILKCSNYFHVMPALHQHDPVLARKVAIGTVQTIAVDGDFYEQQTLQGLGINNGPGSIFGAFGVVWPMMAVDGL